MAKVKHNPFTRGLSGMIGRMLVFRRVGNETIVAAAPTTRSSSTPGQQSQRNRFRLATQYGKQQMTNPLMKAAYALAVKDNSLLTAYNAAVTDYLHAPQITGIDLDQYTGHAYDVIRICATDDFKVAGVTVSIMRPDGTLVESGSAVMEVNGMEWVYTVTTDHDAVAGTRITIKATDIPGNETIEEKVL